MNLQKEKFPKCSRLDQGEIKGVHTKIGMGLNFILSALPFFGGEGGGVKSFLGLLIIRPLVLGGALPSGLSVLRPILHVQHCS